MNKLLLLQKKVVRIVTSSNYLDHCDQLFHRLSVLKINDIYHYICCILAFKTRNNYAVANHSHNTRNATTYLVPQFQRLTISQRSLSYILPFKFNAIPNDIKNVKSMSKFRRCLKEHLVEHYVCG